MKPIAKSQPFVSIIIPLYVIESRFFEDLKKYSRLEYTNYEILIVCDKEVEIDQPKARLILTGEKRTGPAEKRDVALQQAKGEICAFIDDDAYPSSQWLSAAVDRFKEKRVVAVGGTGLTPEEDGFWEKVGGFIYGSVFVSGGFRERFLVGKSSKVVTDWPAYNLLVRTDILKKVGGYGSYFYGGEDTLLCLKLMEYGEIVYDPKAVVYHHRRAFPKAHLKQIFNVGIHRGYFARVFPKTSRMPIYFMPSALTFMFLIMLIFSLFYTKPAVISMIVVIITYLFVFAVELKRAPLEKALAVALGVILTHMVYGTGFIKGFLTLKLDR